MLIARYLCGHSPDWGSDCVFPITYNDIMSHRERPVDVADAGAPFTLALVQSHEVL